MRFSDQVVIVTGAAGVIGAAVAKAFAAQGASLCLADLAPPPTEGAAVSLAVDVSSRAQIEAMVARALEAFGRVDVLVNVAGVVSFGPAATLEEAEWDRVLSINLKGTFLACQAVMPAMKAQGYGRIVNIGSVIAKNGGNARPWIDPDELHKTSNVAYGISKSGVHTLTVFLAKELAAHGITVNAVAPGPVASPMARFLPDKLKALIPAARLGTGEDVADAILFLADRRTSFVTGEILDVNGGMWAD